MLVKTLIIFLCIIVASPFAKAQSWQEMMDSCNTYQQVQDYQTALKWALQAEVKAKAEFGEMDTNNVSTLKALVFCNYNLGNINECAKIQEIILEQSRLIFKVDCEEISSATVDMGFFYNKIGNFAKAEPLFKEALEMYRRIFKGDHPDLANSINSMAMFYNERGNYKVVEPLLKEALEMYRRMFKGDDPSLALSINNMAFFYDGRGNYKDAEPLYKEALEMFRRIFKSDHPELALSIGNMAAFYNGMGNYKDAEPLYKEALEMRRRIFKGDHPDLAISIGNIANFYDSMGNYKDAEPLLIEALEMRRRIFKGDHPNLAASILNMAFFYNGRGNFKDAEQLYKEALEMSRRIFKGDHPALAASINSMANFLNGRGNYKVAEPLYKEALEMRRRIFKGDHPALAMSINDMAGFYNSRGNYKDAEPLYKEALEMSRRIFKDDHPDLALSFINTANFYSDMGNYKEAEPLYLEALNVVSKALNNYLPSLSESEKEKFWNLYSSYFITFNSFAIARMNENPAILCRMFDNQLNTKALLYNSANKIKKRILNSKDSSLIEKYEELASIKENLTKYYSLTKAELQKKQLNIDSIENIANNLEKEISLKSEDYKQGYEKKKIDWRTIQSAIQPEEAVIEIVRFSLYEKNRWTDTVFYAALIVTDQTIENPDIVLLENGNDLEEKYYPAYRNLVKRKFSDKESFKQFWAKIYEKTKQYKKIYFSPDGIYNKLNVSTLELPDGKFLLEMQDVQTLNSSKDLLLTFYTRHEESNVYNSAVLIGNPNFGAAQVQPKITENNTKSDEGLGNKYFSNLREIKLSELPGTETEVSNIEKYLNTKKWDVKKYIKSDATKFAVKTANSPRVLHIATHGFFLPAQTNKDDKYSSTNSLFQTGLFFAGASAKQSKENIGEGLLTAYEAMNLDLDKTELVVLSACETGLGEVRNGEGVFGLRRAFQQAGAKSVLMSLWKVDDEATQELMSMFYKEWLGGKTKREAFKTAQLKLKEKYTYPYYWGAFVMVGE